MKQLDLDEMSVDAGLDEETGQPMLDIYSKTANRFIYVDREDASQLFLWLWDWLGEILNERE